MIVDSLQSEGPWYDENSPNNTNSPNTAHIVNDVQIDLSNYISNYHGFIYYQRLFFIAERCPTLRLLAIQLAHDYIKKSTLDCAAYNRVFLMLAEQTAGTPIHLSASGEISSDLQEVVGRFSTDMDVSLADNLLLRNDGGVLPPSLSDPAKLALANVMQGHNEANLVYDAQWEGRTRRKGTTLLDQLDTELKNYKANSIKESIRRASDDLGDLYLRLGQLNNARKCYMRSRDYCTSQQQEITMCLNVIKVAIFQRAWSQVSVHVSRADGLSELRDAAGLNSQQSTQPRTRLGPAPSSSSSSLHGVMGTVFGTLDTGMERNGSTRADPTGSSGTESGRGFARQSSDGTSSGGQSYRDSIASARTQLAIAAGLVELAARNFRRAAMSFLQVSPDHCEFPTSTIVTQSDLAYFVTLCSLATFDRSELASQVLGSPNMRLLLEAEPDCRDMLQSFHHADYATCLGRLNKLRNFLYLDYFLADHVDLLCRAIRSRAICQYFSPYSSADLNLMAQAFNTTVAQLENELAVLIQDGSIKARIDSHKQLLRVLNVDQRSLTFARALRLVDEYKKRTHSMILRMSFARHKLIYPPVHEDSETTLNYLA